MTVSHGVIGGIFPELLRSLTVKAGCEINFSVVPRARREAIFKKGRADLLVRATHPPRRDLHALFVPLITVCAVGAARVARLNVTPVRVYDYSDAYQALIKALTEQGRLVLAVGPSLARPQTRVRHRRRDDHEPRPLDWRTQNRTHVAADD